MISIEYALPLFIFLVVSFLAFYFLETIMLLVLNHYIHKHLDFVVDTLLRTVVRHRAMVRITAFGTVALVLILLFYFAGFADLLIGDAGVLRLLAVILIVAMLMIYHIGSQSLGDIVIVRRIHLFVFVLLSLVTFTGVMKAAQNGYGVYQEVISQAFVKPIVEGIEQEYSKELEDRLLGYFRSQIKDGKCEGYDYATKTGTGITQFVFIKQDPGLAEEKPEIRPKGEPLAGKRCVHETQFLLTPEGKWYEVLEQNLD
jgi:hypothetical protein